MAQTLKSEMRSRILDAALDMLADRGYAGTSIASVAEAAGVSVGNIYRYFAGKEELAAAALPAERIRGLSRAVTARLEALAASGRSTGARPAAPLEPDAEQLALIAGARRELIFLVEGAEGSPFQGFHSRLQDALVGSFARYRSSGRRAGRGRTERLAGPIFASLVSTMGAVLRSSKDPNEIADGLGLVMRYHLAGMAAILDR